MEKKSSLTNEVISNFKHIAGPTRDELRRIVNTKYDSFDEYLRSQLIKMFAHSKNYDGELIRNKRIVSEKYPFGMEREWRVVIRNNDVPYFLAGDDEISEKNEYNKLLKDTRINFDVEHIKMIIVETDYQEEEIKKIVCKKYKLEEFPKWINIKINTIRHIPDEG